MFLKIKKYQGEKPILYGLNSMQAPYGVSMKEDEILSNKEGHKTVPEGMFVVDVEGVVRFLPRTRITAAVTTSDNSIVVKSPHCSFKVGDTLYAQAYGRVSLDGTSGANHVLTIKIGSDSYSTAVDSAISAAAVTAFVSEHAADLLLKNIVVMAGANPSVIEIYASDQHDLAASCTGGSLSTIITPLGPSLTPLGSVASISAIDGNGYRTITFAGTLAYDLPAESPVGTTVNKYLGIFPDALDFTEEPFRHLAPIISADGVYERNLPYVDMSIKRALDGLHINKYFYKAGA